MSPEPAAAPDGDRAVPAAGSAAAPEAAAASAGTAVRIDIVPAAPYWALCAAGAASPPAEAAHRRRIRAAFARPAVLPVPALPPVAGLGAFGIDAGVDLRTGQRLTGREWEHRCAQLTGDERSAALAAHPAVGVAALLAARSGGALRPWPVSASPARPGGAPQTHPGGAPDHLVLPIDLSAASTADGPLAAVPGAEEFDAAVLAALARRDAAGLRRCAAQAERFAADLTLLLAALELAAAAGLRFAAERGAAAEASCEPVHGSRVCTATVHGHWEAA